MDINSSDIDKIFRENLEGHSSGYVPGSWERMEAMLDAGDRGFMLKNAHRYVLASIITTIILAGAVVAYISGSGTSQNAIAGKSEKVIQTPAISPSVQQKEVTPADNSAAIDLRNNNNINGINHTANTAQTGSTAHKHRTNTGGKTTNTAANNTTTTDEENGLAIIDNDENKAAPATDNNTNSNTTETEETTWIKNNYELTELEGKTSEITLTGATTPEKAVEETNNIFENARAEKQGGSKCGLSYGILAGANFNKVLSTTGSNQFGSGVVAGLFVSKSLKNRFSIGLEASYYRMNGNSLSRTITRNSYFFEKTTKTYSYVTQSLDYLQIPLTVSYNASLRHRFTVGASANVLLNSSTLVAQNQKKSGEYISTTTIEKGVYEDMNRWGWGLTAGYEYNFTSRYTFGIRYNQQLTDILNDTKKQLPANGQLYIKLNLDK